MKRIVCFHLYNDYSGSPKVLRMVLGGLIEKGCRIDLISSDGGVLNELDGSPAFRRYSYSYRFSENPLIVMMRYVWIQVYTFLFAFRYLFTRKTVFYINTLLPVGPALAGRIMGKRVVYHYHENAFVKGAFYRTLSWLMQHLAHEIICVSAYQASFLKRKEGVTVIPNALPRDFVARLHPNIPAAFERKTVLMLSSLKGYKGTAEFLDLAEKLPQYRFLLVINDSRENVDEFMRKRYPGAGSRPANAAVYPRQNDVAEFYGRASLVLSLSDKTKFIETFGLTALEAMTAGLPVIVPTAGGIAEMVEDGRNGYRIDVQQFGLIAARIDEILSNPDLYGGLAEGALSVSRKYSAEAMYDGILSALA